MPASTVTISKCAERVVCNFPPQVRLTLHVEPAFVILCRHTAHSFDRCTPPTGSSTAPPTQTKNKCTCKRTWEFNKRIFVAPNNCGDPDNFMGFDWCPVQGDCVGYDGKKGWDRCSRNEDAIGKTTEVDSSVAAGAAPATSRVAVNTATDGYDSTLQKTLKGCECDSWKNWQGYSFAHNYCGNDKGKGPWCFVKDASCQDGQTYGFCAAPRLTPQTATSSAAAGSGGNSNGNGAAAGGDKAGGFKPANPQCGHGAMVGVSCKCDPTYAGPSCMKCADGFVNYPACISLTGPQPGIPVGAPGARGGQVLRPQQGAAAVAAPDLASNPTGRHHHLLGIFLGCAALVCGSIAVRHLKECCDRRKSTRRLPEL